VRRAEKHHRVWQADDGGTYVLRKFGDVLWQLGRSDDGGKTWKNVFRGEISGNTRGRISRPVAGYAAGLCRATGS
jgi:hypothetical protein